jgi:predicted DNA-binding transcriptional regulator AlpA
MEWIRKEFEERLPNDVQTPEGKQASVQRFREELERFTKGLPPWSDDTWFRAICDTPLWAVNGADSPEGLWNFWKGFVARQQEVLADTESVFFGEEERRWDVIKFYQNPMIGIRGEPVEKVSFVREPEQKQQTPGIEDSGADLSRATIQPPVPTQEELREAFIRFTKAHPEKGAGLAKEFVELAESELPPEQGRVQPILGKKTEARQPQNEERILDLQQAAARTGLSQTQLSRLCRRGALGEKITTNPNARPKPRFSEAELDAYMAQDRRPGPEPGWKDPDALDNRPGQFVQVAEAGRPPSTERVLDLRQAADRTGLSQSRLSRLCDAGRLGEKISKKPRFSEAELDEYMAGERKRGRPPNRKDRTPS